MPPRKFRSNKSWVYKTLLAVIAITLTFVINTHRFLLDRHAWTATATFGPDGLKSLSKVDAERDQWAGRFGRHHHSSVEKNPRILVVYAGPSNRAAKLVELYRKNLEFFMRHGIECDTQDTVIAIGHEFYDDYVREVNELNRRCRREVILISRRDVCYDMEAARLAIYGGVHGIDVRSYDYFVFANCGLTGPAPRASANDEPWTSRFIDLLDDKVKMTGLVLNCDPPHNAHIMSMAYALDREGIDIVLGSGAIFDCLDPPNNDFINSYERKMGKALLAAGYALRPIIGREMILSDENREDCKPCTATEQKFAAASCQMRARYRDVWIESRLREIYDGRIPSLEETVFFKTSRVFPDAIQKLVRWNRTIPIKWQWK